MVTQCSKSYRAVSMSDKAMKKKGFVSACNFYEFISPQKGYSIISLLNR